ncbi:hypothetical protein D3C78_470510 [compost metagenome]
MKDSNDTATIDALEAPRRGRPKTGNALSNAEKQKAYRARLAAEKVSHVQLDLYELASCVASLGFLIREHGESANPAMIALRDRLSEQWRRARGRD